MTIGCAGSSPAPGTFKKSDSINYCENSSVGRARPCQGRGRGFESRLSLNKAKYRDEKFIPNLIGKSHLSLNKAKYRDEKFISIFIGLSFFYSKIL